MCFVSKITITFYEIVNIICQRLTIINTCNMITIVTKNAIYQIITLEKIIFVKSLIALMVMITIEILTRIVNGEYLS